MPAARTSAFTTRGKLEDDTNTNESSLDLQILNLAVGILNFLQISFVNTSESFSYSRKEIIKQIRKLNWKDGFYRSDIGYKVINE